MTSINEVVVKQLEQLNPSERYVEGVVILLKLLENIIKEPQMDKYRTIRLENRIIKEKLLCLAGVREVLQSIGFVQVSEELKIPANVLIGKIKQYRDLLTQRLEFVRNNVDVSSKIEVQQAGPSSSSTGGVVKKKNVKIIPTKSYQDRITFPKVIQFQNQFLQQLEQMSDQVMQYEDERLRYFGRTIIPLETLTESAQTRLRSVQKSIKAGQFKEREPCFNDILLAELTNWFNGSFFQWVNSMPCKRCGSEDVKTKGHLVDNGIRVETYTCCNETSRFYRYNDVAILLRTRKGRCGEYANCFTFLCRCLGFDARLVYATFDHVWTEVYSTSQKRWIHIDPSDNVLDAPLMYQHGWKRNVDYVVAFSRDDVQDVTWRYTNDHGEVLGKRKLCPEKEFLKTMDLLRAKRRSEKCSPVRLKYLDKRTLFELVELMTPKQLTENERKGRSSGSLNWKLSRGEQNVNSFNTFHADLDEPTTKQFNLRYSCAKNYYERYLKDDSQIKVLQQSQTWESLQFLATNMMRKEERDWKMVYLARAEDTDNASIQWNFDFSAENLKIKDIHLKIDTKTYETGSVEVVLLNEDDVRVNGLGDLKNASKFSIKVLLSGGKGDNAWQHTQLFRQPMGSGDFPFDINILFF